MASFTPPIVTNGVLVLLGVSVLLGAGTMVFPIMGTDAGVFTYVGHTILAGGLPYRDAWDPSGPAVYFVYAVKSALLGRSDLSLRVFDLIWQFGTAVTIMHIGRRALGARGPGLVAGLLYLAIYYTRYFPDMAGPDGLSTLPLALAVLLSLRVQRDETLVRWASIGLCVGIAALFKLPLGAIGLLFAGQAIALGQGWTRVFPRGLALGAGFAAPLVACGGYFAMRGGFADLIYTVFIFGPEYVARARATMSTPCLVDRAARLSLVPLYGLSMLAAGFVAHQAVRRRAWSAPVLILVGWSAVILLIFVWHGKYNLTHSLPLIAPLSLLGTLAARALWHKSQRLDARLRLVIALSMAVLIFLPVLERTRRNAAYTYRALSGQTALANWFDVGEWDDLASYLSAHTAPGDTFFLWGNESSVYLTADRRSPSRFIHAYFLSISWSTPVLRDTFLNEFRESPPRYFVLVTKTTDNPCSSLYRGSLPGYLDFPELRAIVERDYEREWERAGFVVFGRRSVANLESRPADNSRTEARTPSR